MGEPIIEKLQVNLNFNDSNAYNNSEGKYINLAITINIRHKVLFNIIK